MSGKDNTAIKVSNVSKNFVLNHEKTTSIKSSILNLFREKRQTREEHRVLKGVSFEVKKGEFFGIVGRNGSGKSTLLKIISEIYQPTAGSVEVDGKLVPFIELGVGFNPELTGRENVYLNGALLGFNKKEIDAMYSDIVEFAELEQFMDQKLKNYSSGMQVRLAFSVAIKAQGDILVLDEVLAVGDEAFQRKCANFFDQIKKDKTKTVILVTHTMENVRKYCDRAIMIRDGKIIIEGSPEDVSNEYSLENLSTGFSSRSDEDNEGSPVNDLRVELLPEKQLNQDGNLEIKISYRVPTKISTRVKVSIQDLDRNVPIFAADSPVINKEEVRTSLYVKLNAINDTNMKVFVSIRNKDYDTLHFLPESKAPTFSLKRSDYPNPTRKTTWAILFDRGEWR